MNRNWKRWMLYLGLLALWAGQIQAAEEAHDDHEGEETEAAIELTADQQRQAGVVIDRVAVRPLDETLRVPGEVVVNAYQSARVTPRIPAQVMARHAKLGDRVEAGQPLVTLSSVAMSEAQGALIVAEREWQRVKSLGRDAVSERRYTEAQVAQQQAFATVLAYGMTQSQAAALMNAGDAGRADGSFELLAPQSGTVLSDDFIVGELIEPGRVLIDISDEDTAWVEARTAPGSFASVSRGSAARVSVDGSQWLNGTVIQRHHTLDEATRTQNLRIAVDNSGDALHPGLFVEVELTTGNGDPVLAVPNTALTMIDGQPTVFKLEGEHELHPQAVETGPTIGGWTIVRNGLAAGESIAVAGVFHLKSLLLKSSLGEGHGH
ncbi:MAG: efflux RND transporter periplasmic adaptor subunit [Pseudomonadales bacterium]